MWAVYNEGRVCVYVCEECLCVYVCEEIHNVVRSRVEINYLKSVREGCVPRVP